MIRRKTDYIVLHCSATPPTADIGAAEIRQWHTAKGWSDIGYHFVVRRDGEVEDGRPLDQVGSHVRNHNANSVGVCLVGGTDARQRPQSNFTRAQWTALKALLSDLQMRFPRSLVIGHRDFPGVNKACPCFDAVDWARTNGFRPARRMQPVTASMLRAVKVEVEDGDEQDDDLPAQGTGPGKWLTAILGSGGAGSLAGFGYGMDWLSLLILMGGLIAVTCGILLAIGRQRRERIWDSLFGTRQ